ncbi:hypothetical protein DYB30_006246 [Aphanomyces astaci]|uniref:Cyclic nucleotide-binding domain-containing protein n=2 Tax=Aphanomyces astaci TaxID=112090 RepID=A0A397D9A6_APHAT|nr:hypothetical protein DYB30_006246 [Aphanomyces astaci]
MTDQPHHPAKINPDTRELARSLTKNGLADASLDTSEAHQTSHSILQPVATPPLEVQPSGSNQSPQSPRSPSHRGSSLLKSIMVKGFGHGGSSGHARGAFTPVREPVGRRLELSGQQPVEAPASVKPVALTRSPSSSGKHGEGSTRRHLVKMATMRNAVTHAVLGGESINNVNEPTVIDVAAKSFMISTKLRKKAQHIRTTRRETWQKKQVEAQGILLRHKKVLEQYNIRTVRREELHEAKPTLTGSNRFLILPTYGWYKGWQLMTLVIVLHQSVYIPYSLSFESSNDTPVTGTPLTNFVNIVFGLDMLFNFNTAISDPDAPDILITNRWIITRRFILDLLACLPIDMIVDFLLHNNQDISALSTSSSFSSNLNVFALLKVLRLPRLFRLARFVRILRLLRIPPELKRWLLYSRYAHLIRVVQLIASFVYCTHILNCVWNALNTDWVHDVFPSNTVSNIYVLGFYYTLTTLMGQSIPLRTETQYTFSCLVIVVGALLMAMVFGNVMNLMRLPLDLQNRINEYYQVMWERHGTLDGQPLVFTNELSKNLAVEVELFVRMDMINRVPVFQQCSKKVVQDLVMNLELQVYLPGDYIVVKGEVGMDMYFVQNGECEVTKPPATRLGNDEVLKKLFQGDYFGEIALLMNCKRTANVRAITFAELCVLSRSVFEQITDKYAEDREKIETFITEMYDPKVLEAIMKQQSLDNPEKTFHARLTKQMAEIFDFMEDSAIRMERLEWMIESMLGRGASSTSNLHANASQASMRKESYSGRHRGTIESNDEMRKAIQDVSSVLEHQERIHNKDTSS